MYYYGNVCVVLMFIRHSITLKYRCTCDKKCQRSTSVNIYMQELNTCLILPGFLQQSLMYMANTFYPLYILFSCMH